MINIWAWCYRIILFPFAFLVTHLLWWIAPAKLKASLRLKWKSPKKGLTPQTTIMIHAASGEIEYAKPLIRELQLKFPQKRILVTYSSPSIHRLLSTNELFSLAPLPFDFYFLMKSFLQRHHIEMVYIARSDVWLNLTWACHHLKIPCVLFAATQAHPLSYIKAQQFKFLTHIFTVTEEDRQHLSTRLSIPITAIGDPRFDQVFYRLEHPKSLPKKIQTPEQSQLNVFIAGSLWPQDFEVLRPLLPQLLQKNYQIILAPHEIEATQLQWYENQILALNLPLIRYQNYTDSQPFKILLFDQIGYLAELYSLSDLAFVGGSFKAKVHSVMEPLAAGNLVLVGPHHTNNREALEFKKYLLTNKLPIYGVTAIRNTNEAESFFKILDLAKLEDLKKQVHTLCHKHQGATYTLIQLTWH